MDEGDGWSIGQLKRRSYGEGGLLEERFQITQVYNHG